jgi:hypothetical protein
VHGAETAARARLRLFGTNDGEPRAMDVAGDMVVFRQAQEAPMANVESGSRTSVAE